MVIAEKEYFHLARSVNLFCIILFYSIGWWNLWWKLPQKARTFGTCIKTRLWFPIFFIFTPTWGNDAIWRAYFSNGLVQPPTRKTWRVVFNHTHGEAILAGENFWKFFPKLRTGPRLLHEVLPVPRRLQVTLVLIGSMGMADVPAATFYVTEFLSHTIHGTGIFATWKP